MTQSTVTLSSAEAELSGIAKGASVSLGLVSIAKDLGFDWALAIHTDATAAIGIARRNGLGKVRHLAVADLWVQEKVKTGALSLHNIKGDENASDILTKFVARPLMCKHLSTLNLYSEPGRASLGPTI